MRLSEVAVSRPYVYPLVCSLVSLVGFIVTQSNNSGQQGLNTLLAGISTATFASYITLVLVDRSFRQQEKNRREKMQIAALRQLKYDINSHITFLTDMYIAALDERQGTPPSTFEEVFDEDFTETVQLLDFSKEYPTARNSKRISWFDRSESHLEEFSDSIDQVISQYSPWLEPEVVEILQDLNNSIFMGMITSASSINIIQMDEEMGYEREYSILLGHPEIIEEHTGAVLEIIQKYNEQSEVELTDAEDLNAWSENVAPTRGTVRLESESLSTTDQNE